MQNTIQTSLIEEKNEEITSTNIIEKIKQANWKKKPYSYQNWGNWLHRMSAYTGRMKPGMAHWLIRAASKKNDTILDPFCGTGTIPLEADLEGRNAIGVDLNCYAFIIT